jgi:hypothetical protein
MASLDMAAINLAATDLASHSWPIADAVGPAYSPTAVALMAPLEAPVHASRLDEPSSLALALVGVATLAAYRAVVHQVVGRASTKPTLQPLVKPRRRAA